MRYLLLGFLVLFVVLVLPATAQNPEADEIVGLELLDDYPAVQFWFEGHVKSYYSSALDRSTACNEFLATDVIMTQARDTTRGDRSSICGYFAIIRAHYPNFTFTLKEVVADDNFVVVRYTAHYSHPDTGITTYPGMAMFQLEEEQLKAIWDYFDWCDVRSTFCAGEKP